MTVVQQDGRVAAVESRALSDDPEAYENAVAAALGAVDAAAFFAAQERVLLKPNLVNDSPFPVTTPVAMVRAVLRYARQAGAGEVVVAEGCGQAGMETGEIFARLGYEAMAREEDVRLIDLNHEPCTMLTDDSRTVHRTMELPEIAFTHAVVSLPVLKAHSLSKVTGSLKNMMGLLPPTRYGAGAGGYKKSQFHGQLQECIADLITYRSPDLAVMDGTVGLRDYHLGGARCDPPVGKILASFDAKALDREAAGLLGLDWRAIAHLR
ncbi:DUF362 domain-containing protein [Oceanidesulfovibrio marinus]|uniref:DUF362 domain-containing protein n=1 Tax=Oceanidesulfovibrio marinus TaxID=370038 RepID=A0ABX6NEW8_9BACT|nr:DUF362 domain-containing protein [Oceanidesulfovibrio marinus]QJT09152.1 DUF362 domain-containing protein [Oceanidesulfovibrio marinus]